MKACANCGRQLEDWMRFCDGCGALQSMAPTDPRNTSIPTSESPKPPLPSSPSSSSLICRMCGGDLDASAKFCRRCGTAQPITPSQSILEPVRTVSTIQLSPKFWHLVQTILPLTVLVVFAAYLLGQYVASTEVKTYYTDDTYYSMILSALRSNPTAYYSISQTLYHHLYQPAPSNLYHFPLIFYIWLLLPNVADVKWLYFGFALAGTMASYFAVYTVTRQSLVAALSGAWMAYFLETNAYFMFEYWAIAVFLVGLAFFISERYASAAILIGVATLIKEVFAPFMLIASIYYLLASRKEWWPPVYDCVRRKYDLMRKRYDLLRRHDPMRRYDFVMHRETMRRRQHMENRKTKLALVWIVVTSAVGFMYILNDIASREGGGLLLSGFIQTPATNMLGFEPGVLWLLFTEDYFTRPPIPVILAVALALVGMAFLDKDQSIITYLSFAQLPLLIAMGVVTTEPGLTIAVWRTWTNVPSRWIAMSITMVNLFWLVAPYALAKHIYRWGVLRCEKAAYGIS